MLYNIDAEAAALTHYTFVSQIRLAGKNGPLAEFLAA